MREFDVIVVGAGPAGIFTALELQKEAPQARVLIVDAGSSIDRRNCPARKTGHCVGCQPCGIMQRLGRRGRVLGRQALPVGGGGRPPRRLSAAADGARSASNIADDHVSRASARPMLVHGLNDPKVDEFKYECPASTTSSSIPCPVRHMGTEYAFDVLRDDVPQAVSERTGFTFQRAHHLPRTYSAENGARRRRRILDQRAARRELESRAKYVVAAPGRGGRGVADRRSLTARASPPLNNEVDIGVRVEVPNSVMDHLTKHLYEAKLVYYSDTFENKVRTFCMNPGGLVSEEHYEGGIAVVNGHSYADEARHTENTNFAMLVSTQLHQAV